MLAIPVIQLLKDSKGRLELELVAGKDGLSKRILIPRIQKPGLALAGDITTIHHGRIQILGEQEMRYLSTLNSKALTSIVKTICKADVTCFIITCNKSVPPVLKSQCNVNGIPLMRSRLLTSTLINRLNRFLDNYLTGSITIHGVLVDVFGIGILIIGKSGIGKSECALDLILHGHRLVSDDIVLISKKPPSTLYGTGSEIIRYHMEIRGLGIINIRDLFGIAAIRERKIIEMVVELHEWDPKIEYDRLGLNENSYSIMDVRLPFIQIPVRPGRNITTIIEIAARNQLLKIGGHNSAQEFQERLNAEILARREEQELAMLE